MFFSTNKTYGAEIFEDLHFFSFWPQVKLTRSRTKKININQVPQNCRKIYSFEDGNKFQM